jgi:hypothetical protein
MQSNPGIRDFPVLCFSLEIVFSSVRVKVFKKMLIKMCLNTHFEMMGIFTQFHIDNTAKYLTFKYLLRV